MSGLPKFSIADTMTAKDRARALPLPDEVRLAILPWVNKQSLTTPLYTTGDLMTPEDRASALPLPNEIQRAILSQAGGEMGNDFTVGDILTNEEKALALPIMEKEVRLAILPRVVPWYVREADRLGISTEEYLAQRRAEEEARRIAEAGEEEEEGEEPEPEPTQREVLVWPRYRGIAGDSYEDGVGDAILDHPIHSPGCMSQEFYDTYWDGELKQNRPIRNYLVADFPSSIISARIEVYSPQVYGDPDPFERWGALHLAHYHKAELAGKKEDYEATCTDFASVNQVGYYVIFYITDLVKNAQNAGEQFFTTKSYFATNEITEEACGMRVDQFALYMTYWG